MNFTKTIYVSSNGNDLNNGLSENTPLLSIDLAAKKCADNTMLLIEGGKVYEGSMVFKNLNNIFIGSYGVGAPIIKSDTTVIKFSDCSDITVSKLKLVGKGYYVTNNSTGILADKSNNLLIKNIEAMGFHNAGISISGCKDVEVIGCFTHNNGAVGICTGTSKNILCENIRITYCKAYNNAGDVAERNGHSGSGIIIAGTKHSVVEFCEATGNGWAQRQIEVNGPVGIWCCCGCIDVVFRYNIARYNRTQPGAVDGDGLDIDGEVKDGLMEYNYTYGNEGSGYLFCEFWGNCSEVLWENNTTRYCVSFGDDTRVLGYGSINMSCPKDAPFNRLYINNNFFVASENMRCITNKNILAPGEDMIINDNICISDGTRAIEVLEHPYMTVKDNICIEDNSVRNEFIKHAPLLTNPRDLLNQPIFELLKNGECYNVFKEKGVSALFKTNNTVKKVEGERFFELQMYGPDTEGCAKNGNVALYYDSVKPGVVTKLSGAGAEFLTPLPWWDKDKRYIVRATARLQSPDVIAYLFVRDEKGQEKRAFFNTSVAEYSFVELEFKDIDKWLDPGKFIGVKQSGGEGEVYVYSLDFIKLDDENDYVPRNDKMKEISDFRSFGDCCDKDNSMELYKGGNIEKTLQTSQKEVNLKIVCEGISSAGIAYIISGNRTETAKIAEGNNGINIKIKPDGDTVTIGVSQNSDSEGTIKISKMELR